MLPKEDVCGTCADLQALISRSRTVETHLKHAEALKAHIDMATQARDIYRQCIEDAKQSRADCTPDQTPKYHIANNWRHVRIAAIGESPLCVAGYASRDASTIDTTRSDTRKN